MLLEELAHIEHLSEGVGWGVSAETVGRGERHIAPQCVVGTCADGWWECCDVVGPFLLMVRWAYARAAEIHVKVQLDRARCGKARQRYA